MLVTLYGLSLLSEDAAVVGWFCESASACPVYVRLVFIPFLLPGSRHRLMKADSVKHQIRIPVSGRVYDRLSSFLMSAVIRVVGQSSRTPQQTVKLTAEEIEVTECDST